MSQPSIFDIGLHRGEDTAYYLALGYDVVGFEADPWLIRQCTIRFADAIQRGRLRIVPGAIVSSADTCESVTFYRNLTKSVWGTVAPSWAARNLRMAAESEPILVPAVDLRAEIPKYGVPYYAKIDIEGSDMLAVDALCSGRESPAFISIESSKISIDHVEKEVNTLAQHGYRRFQIVQQCNIPGTSISVSDLSGKVSSFRFEKHASGPFGFQLPNKWCSQDEVLLAYRRVFRAYRLIGDEAPLRRYSRLITKPLERIGGFGLPGWHDLHAMHESMMGPT